MGLIQAFEGRLIRVGLVIYGSPDTVSGGYLYDRKLVEYLRSQGDSVEIISLPWRNYPRHLADNLSSGLLRRLAGLQLDVLLEDELNHPSLFMLNRRLRKQAGYPVVSIVHHLRSSERRPSWQNDCYRRVERLYLSGVDGLIYNSRTTRDVVENLLGTKPPGIVAYPGGDRMGPQASDLELIEKAHDGVLRLLFVGNLTSRKGLHVLLEAVKKLPAGQWALTVAGNVQADFLYARRMLYRVRMDGLTEHVHFTGAISDDELAAHMKASHLLAVPSSYEGYGIVYIEGMGFGLPAIATTGGAAGEIITHDRDGYLISPGDDATLTEHLAALIKDHRRLLEMSMAARRRYLLHPTWEESMGNIRAFLAGLAER